MKNIASVPESITREAYKKLVASAGFDTKKVRRLDFRLDGIYAEVYDQHPDKDGVQIHAQVDEAIVNRVWIPVRD